MKYRKKPVVIDAVQFTSENMPEVTAFIGGENGGKFIARPPGGLGIQTLEGTMWATPGDWIIKGVKGEFYPCKPDIFAATYEPA
jgi:hypothetical protein